jgi:hypothetical protein
VVFLSSTALTSSEIGTLDASTYYLEDAPLLITSISGTYGTPLSLTTSGGTTAGSVSYVVDSAGRAGCSVSGSTLSATSAGTCVVTATMAGNTDYNPVSSSPTTITVNPAASTTALSLSSGSIAYGHEQAETMSVTVSAQSSTLVPTGTVTISAGSATICAITLVDGKGSCTLSASQLQRGTYELVATFAGNADVNGSSSPASSLAVTVKSAIDYYVALLHGLWVANGEPRIGTAKYRSIAHEAWIEAGKPKLPPLLFKQAHAGA